MTIWCFLRDSTCVGGCLVPDPTKQSCQICLGSKIVYFEMEYTPEIPSKKTEPFHIDIDNGDYLVIHAFNCLYYFVVEIRKRHKYQISISISRHFRHARKVYIHPVWPQNFNQACPLTTVYMTSRYNPTYPSLHGALPRGVWWGEGRHGSPGVIGSST